MSIKKSNNTKPIYFCTLITNSHLILSPSNMLNLIWGHPLMTSFFEITSKWSVLQNRSLLWVSDEIDGGPLNVTLNLCMTSFLVECKPERWEEVSRGSEEARCFGGRNWQTASSQAWTEILKNSFGNFGKFQTPVSFSLWVANRPVILNRDAVSGYLGCRQLLQSPDV